MVVALEGLERLYRGRALVARVDVTTATDAAARYGVTCLPTILLFERGHVVRRFLGTAMLWELEAALCEVIPTAV